MEEYSQEIVDNIKHEPEVHFTCYLPKIPESDEEPEVQEVRVVVRKFDKKWKSTAKLFKSYFVCGKCEHATKTTGNLKQHLKVCKTRENCENCFSKCKSQNIIKCVFCDQQFYCKNCKSIHNSDVHRKDSTWQCSKCDYKTLNRKNLRQHYQIHDKKFSCSTCEQKFSHKQLLGYHQQNHRHGEFATGPEEKYDCSACIKSFTTKHGLRFHERDFHRNIKLHCDVCGKTSKRKYELRQHMQTHQKVPCPVCYHLLAQRYLDMHIAKHTTNPKFKCVDCDKVYFNQNDLNMHKSTKHEIEKVQCDLCQKISKNKPTLRLHMRIHLKVSCQFCGKSINKHRLYYHKKLHLSKRESLACAIVHCRQKSSNIKELEDHKQIHIAQQIYKCPTCNHQSKTLQKIKTHMICHSA